MKKVRKIIFFKENFIKLHKKISHLGPFFTKRKDPLQLFKFRSQS